jgi:succinate dehydrogenase / fumarate reductase cytochrome b subunit
MGITWGVWISPAAQQRASNICMGFGVLLAVVGLTAIYAAATVDVPAARAKEKTMLEENIRAGYVKEDPHKVAPPLESNEVSQADANGKHNSK